MTTRATEGQYRAALQMAERALMHASKKLTGPSQELAKIALAQVTGVLDIGRDEANEQVAT
jgi:hypothetical protein